MLDVTDALCNPTSSQNFQAARPLQRVEPVACRLSIRTFLKEAPRQEPVLSYRGLTAQPHHTSLPAMTLEIMSPQLALVLFSFCNYAYPLTTPFEQKIAQLRLESCRRPTYLDLTARHVFIPPTSPLLWSPQLTSHLPNTDRRDAHLQPTARVRSPCLVIAYTRTTTFSPNWTTMGVSSTQKRKRRTS